MAVDPESWLQIYPEFTFRRTEEGLPGGSHRAPSSAVDLAERFGWKVGDRVPLQGVIYRTPNGEPWEFTIVGIYDSLEKGVDKSQFFFHYDYMNETIRNQNYGHDQVGWYVDQAQGPGAGGNDGAEARRDVRQLAERDQDGHRERVHRRLRQADRRHRQHHDRDRRAVLFTILLVSANTMAQSIRERTNELAILKTLGFSDGTILGLVLAESCLIALVGGALGLAVSWPIVSFVAVQTNGMVPPLYLPVARHRHRRGDHRGAGLRDRAVAGGPGQAAEDRRRVEERVVRCCLRSSPSPASTCARCASARGSSAVAVIGIIGVVIVFVGVLSIAEGFRSAMKTRRRRRHGHGDARRRRLGDDQRHERRSRPDHPGQAGHRPRRAGPAGLAGAAGDRRPSAAPERHRRQRAAARRAGSAPSRSTTRSRSSRGGRSSRARTRSWRAGPPRVSSPT